MKVACCFLEYDNKIWIVARHNSKTHSIEWDVPADKVKYDESSKDTTVRIIANETGYDVKEKDLQTLGKFDFVSSKNEPYIMCVFKVDIDDPHPATAGTLHGEWVTPEECVKKKNLIKNFANLLKLASYI